MESPQRCHITNQSFIAKLCSCCLFFNTNAKPQPEYSSPRHEKKPKTSTKEPLIQEKNPILNLKPQLKPSERESKGLGVVLFKKTMCNCEFLKELNRNNDLYYIENKSHYDKLLNNKKMNPEKKKRLSDNFRVLNILNKFPKNRVFLLKYNSSAILCKITYQNFKFPFIRKKVKAGTRSLMVKKPSTTSTNEPNMNVINQLLQTDEKFDNPIEQIDEKLNIFSKFHQGIKINSDSFDKILPEKVCEYLAKKIKKNSFVLDGFCGVGAASIQFAMEGHLVMAFEMNEQKFKFAVNNSIVYNIKPKIDFIRGNMLSYRGRQRIDLVFLLMEYENMKPCNDNFCLFADILPDIRKTLEKALEISPNVVLVLPKFIDVSELALLCTDIHHHRPELFKSFSLEIECLAFNSKIEKYAVYFGDLKTITPQEEMDCLIHTLNGDSQTDVKAPETHIFIQHIIEKIGIFETCQSYLEIENCSIENPHKTDTNFQLFLEKVLKEGLLSKDDISEYINTTKMKDYMKKTRQAGDSKDGTYTFNPFKFQSLEKCTMSAKSYGKDFANNSPYNSIDLRDDNLTKKQMDRISMGENFLEKDNVFFSLGQDYIMKKKASNSNAPSNTENNNTSSIYSDINFDMSSDNSKNREFEETEVVEKQSLAKKTVF